MPARDQAGAIPFRHKRNVIEVCLIRDRGRKKWKIPKGFVDPGETPRQTALKEAWEEAGLRGRLVGESIGSYRYEKWNLDLTVAVFLMEVKEVAEKWEESGSRERGWAPLENALARLRNHPVKPLLSRVSRRLEQRKPASARGGSKV